MIIVGAKGFAIQLHDTLYRSDQCNDIVFYDDVSPDDQKKFLDTYPILRSINDVNEYWKTTADRRFALGVGGPGNRKILFEKFLKLGGVPYSVISRDSIIGPLHVRIDEGVCILQNCIIESTVQIGKGTMINLNTIVTHHTEIGEFCEISPGVHICGRCRIGNNVYIGTAATILPGIKIGNNAIIGAGALVTKNIEAGIKVMGVPAKPNFNKKDQK